MTTFLAWFAVLALTGATVFALAVAVAPALKARRVTLPAVVVVFLLGALWAPQLARLDEAAALSVRAGPTWVVRNPWGFAIATIGPEQVRTVRPWAAAAGLAADGHRSACREGRVAALVGLELSVLAVETRAGRWVVPGPPPLARLGYDEACAARLAAGAPLPPHRFEGGRPRFDDGVTQAARWPRARGRTRR